MESHCWSHMILGIYFCVWFLFQFLFFYLFSFLQGVLDYVDNLDMSQIHKLYGVLCRLAFSPASGDSSMQVWNSEETF